MSKRPAGRFLLGAMRTTLKLSGLLLRRRNFEQYSRTRLKAPPQAGVGFL
jgi:hypothetical protein